MTCTAVAMRVESAPVPPMCYDARTVGELCDDDDEGQK